jgi:TonB family protein
MSAHITLAAVVIAASITAAAHAQSPATAPGAYVEPALAKFPVVNVCVNRRSRLTRVTLTHSSGIPEIDAEALRVAQASHYQPAVTQSGRKARESCLDVRVRFDLRNGVPVLDGGEPSAPAEIIQAGTTQKQDPVVRACVDANGALTSTRIVQSSGIAEVDAAALEVAQASRYSPGTTKGKSQDQSCVDFRVKFAVKDGETVLDELTPTS